MNGKFSVHRFDANNLPSREILEQSVLFFNQNYPSMHARLEKWIWCLKRRSADAMRKVLENNFVWQLALSSRGEILGLLESFHETEDNYTVEYLVWLMTRENMRGRGVGSTLHKAFEKEAQTHWELTGIPGEQQLVVHKKNTDALRTYQKWGYEVGGDVSRNKHWMKKNIQKIETTDRIRLGGRHIDAWSA